MIELINVYTQMKKKKIQEKYTIDKTLLNKYSIEFQQMFNLMLQKNKFKYTSVLNPDQCQKYEKIVECVDQEILNTIIKKVKSLLLIIVDHRVLERIEDQSIEE